VHYSALLHIIDPLGKLRENFSNIGLFNAIFGSAELFDPQVEILRVEMVHQDVDICLIFKYMVHLDYLRTF
jgi:hypothetical protein